MVSLYWLFYIKMYVRCLRDSSSHPELLWLDNTNLIIWVDIYIKSMWPCKYWTQDGALGPECIKVFKSCVKMWFKWTKYSDQTNFEPKVFHEANQRHWNVFRIRFTWSKYLYVAAFLRPNYWNSLAMKIYKRHGHHVNCLANMVDTAR